MTLGQGHDTPLGHGQKCKKYYPNSTLQYLVSYGPEKDYGYVCSVTLMIRPWFKVRTHPWVIDYNCVKYYLNPT